MRTMLATVPFQIGTSITSSSPFSPDIVTFTSTNQSIVSRQISPNKSGTSFTCLVVEVMESMEHMKMSATMKTATKL